jgi:hypothetical protein
MRNYNVFRPGFQATGVKKSIAQCGRGWRRSGNFEGMAKFLMVVIQAGPAAGAQGNYGNIRFLFPGFCNPIPNPAGNGE